MSQIIPQARPRLALSKRNTPEEIRMSGEEIRMSGSQAHPRLRARVQAENRVARRFLLIPPLPPEAPPLGRGVAGFFLARNTCRPACVGLAALDASR
jgi:hypothetical protein